MGTQIQGESFYTLAENSIQGVLVHREGRLLYANDALASLFGYASPDDMAAMAVLDLFAPHERARLRDCGMRRLHDEAVPRRYEVEGRRRDGSPVWMESLVSVVSWNGAPAVLMSVVDIGHRKQVEADPVESNQALQREIARRIRIGTLLKRQNEIVEMLVRDCPLSDVLTEIVRAMEEQVPEMIGSILLLDSGRLWHGAAPGLPHDYVEAINGVSIGPAVGSCGTAAHERRRVIVDDIAQDPLWAEYRDLALRHHLRACWSAPIMSSQDQVLGTFAMYYRTPRRPSRREQQLLDLSVHLASLAIEQHRKHEDLQSSEARYRELFESAHDMVCTFDLNGRFTALNAAAERITGYTRAEALRLNLADLLVPEFRDRVLPMITAQHGSFQLPHTCDIEIVAKDGCRVPLEVSMQQLLRGNKPVGVQAIARDVTVRRRLEAQLRQAQKMEAIGALAGGIAHDFNNILAAILGYTELALTDLPADSRVGSNLREVMQAGKRARDLVKQILAFSRQTEAERRPVSLRPLIQEAVRLLRATLPSNVTIRTELDQAPDTVLADPTQMHQVLMNLCINAEHAMRPHGGELTIALEALELGTDHTPHPALPPGPYVCLRVRDTGGGMSPELLERIFDPYFTTKNVGEGTGMGLAVVHGIVAEHGGHIGVESRLDEGTEFCVYLPRLLGHDESPGGHDTPDLRGGTECILFVDDEPALARLGQGLLSRLGYEVVIRTSSVEALEAFRAAPQRYDLLITDHTMPTLSGEALIDAVRRLRPDLPVVLCTGFSHTMTKSRARELGVDAFLLKPLLFQDLAQTVHRVLHRSDPLP